MGLDARGLGLQAVWQGLAAAAELRDCAEAHLTTSDLHVCRLVSRSWRFTASTLHLVLPPPIASHEDDRQEVLPPHGLLGAADSLTLLMDDSRMALLQHALRMGRDPLVQLRDRLLRLLPPASSPALHKLRLHFHASLAMLFSRADSRASHPSVWCAHAGPAIGPLLRQQVHALEVIVTGHGRTLKAPILSSLLAPCPAVLRSLSLQLPALDDCHWAALAPLLPHLTSLSLRTTSRHQWPQQQQQQAAQPAEPAPTDLPPGPSHSQSPSEQPSKPQSDAWAALQSLVLSTPALSRGMPLGALQATGLRTLLLHGARVPCRLGDPASGLGCLKGLQQLQTLGFCAPILASSEWACLLRLSTLTELRVNDWSAPGGSGGSFSGLLAPVYGRPSGAFDLRPLAVRHVGTADRRDDVTWAEDCLNGGGGAAVQRAAAGGADADAHTEEEEEGREGGAVVSLGPLVPLGALCRLQLLRATLAHPLQLAALAGLQGGLPRSLRSLHVSFVDGGPQQQPQPQQPAEGGAAVAAAAELVVFAEEAAGELSSLGLATPVQARSPRRLRALLSAVPPQPRHDEGDSFPAAAADEHPLWPALTAACPCLTDLNVRRSYTLALGAASAAALPPSMRELQFCGTVCSPGSGALLRALWRLRFLSVLSLGSITGPALEVPTALLPPRLESLSLLNAIVFDGEGSGEQGTPEAGHGGTRGAGDGFANSEAKPGGAQAWGGTSATMASLATSDGGGGGTPATPGLPVGLQQLQLKLCRWLGRRGSGLGPAPDGGGGDGDGAVAMLAAVAGSCPRLTQLRLSLDGGGATDAADGSRWPLDSGPNVASLPRFTVLAALPRLGVLDLSLCNMPHGFIAATAVQLARLTALRQLRLSVRPRLDDDVGKCQEDTSEGEEGEEDDAGAGQGGTLRQEAKEEEEEEGGWQAAPAAAAVEGVLAPPLSPGASSSVGPSAPGGNMASEPDATMPGPAAGSSGPAAATPGQRALLELCSLRGLQSLELEVLGASTARLLEAHLVLTLPHCRFTLVVDNFEEMMAEMEERLEQFEGVLDEGGGLAGGEDDAAELAELVEELAALEGEP